MTRSVFKKDELGMEIAQIAIPATLTLAADPIASLIDTAFIGHIGLYSQPLCISQEVCSRRQHYLPFLMY